VTVYQEIVLFIATAICVFAIGEAIWFELTAVSRRERRMIATRTLAMRTG
jgi:hypothetical protein